MAAVLPHAPPLPKAVPQLKVPAAAVPTKSPGTHAETPSLKAKFQTLLDQAAKVLPKRETAVPVVQHEAPKAAKVKVPDHAEKPREAKKADPKDSKDKAHEGADNVWAAVLHQQPKVDPLPKPVTPTQGADAVSAATDKAKSPKDLRDLKRPGSEGLATNLATPVNAEAAKSQGPAPRTERTEDKQKVFVVDRRTDKEKEKLKTPEAAAQQPVNASVEVQQSQKSSDPKASADIQVTYQAVAGKGSDGFDLKAQQTPVAPRDAASFQQYLVEKGYGQLVDQARIVLKDQNAGEIRMTLYPESLGKVKVALNLDDNSLAGQIYVENQTVKDVFQANMDGLMQAFRDGGYSDLSLQVSVGNGNGGQNASQNQGQAATARDYGRQVSSSAPVEVRADRYGSWTDRQINLTA
jgi:flagellar hook-length control protein FliK